MGYRSLFLKIVNDFIFSEVPDGLKSLASEDFDDPLTLATARGINWTVWLARNFPRLNAVAYQLPRRVVALVTSDFEGTYQVSDVSCHEGRVCVNAQIVGFGPALIPRNSSWQNSYDTSKVKAPPRTWTA